MLINATLLRVDPPPPGGTGPTVSLRCVLDTPTAAQQAQNADMGWGATRVLYLPMASLPPGVAPAAGGSALVQLDGCPAATFQIAHVVDRAGPLAHLQLFLAPAPPPPP